MVLSLEAICRLDLSESEHQDCQLLVVRKPPGIQRRLVKYEIEEGTVVMKCWDRVALAVKAENDGIIQKPQLAYDLLLDRAQCAVAFSSMAITGAPTTGRRQLLRVNDGKTRVTFFARFNFCPSRIHECCHWKKQNRLTARKVKRVNVNGTCYCCSKPGYKVQAKAEG